MASIFRVLHIHIIEKAMRWSKNQSHLFQIQKMGFGIMCVWCFLYVDSSKAQTCGSILTKFGIYILVRTFF